MKTMQDWFDAYGVSHVNKTNKAIHWICVPLIFFSIIGLLSLIPFGFVSSLFPEAIAPYIHVGTLLILFGMVFFFRLSFSIGLGMTVISAVILQIVFQVNTGYTNAWVIYLAIFVGAWIGQFIGHKIEGAKPSFFDDLKFLMIGPAWLLHFIYKKLGIPI